MNQDALVFPQPVPLRSFLSKFTPSRSIPPFPNQLITRDSTNATPRPFNHPDSAILDNLVTHAG